MATLAVKPASNLNLPQNFTFQEDATHLCDASFSTYLSSGEETFVLKLGELTRNLSSAEPLHQMSFGRKNVEDGEISIFSAEKYFNGVMDDDDTGISEKGTKQRPKREAKINLRHPVTLIKPGTPSACSEVSWNSQSMLLPAVSKDSSLKSQKQANDKKYFGKFSCKCSCSGKRSVDIDENVGDNTRNSSNSKKIFYLGEPQISRNPVGLTGNKTNQPEFRRKEETGFGETGIMRVGLKRDDCFTFPILNHPLVGNLTVGKQLQEEEKARISLEVFGSTCLEKEDIKSKQMMLTLDSGRRITDIPAASSGDLKRDDEDDDLGSDSSSDLFEIESLSSNAHPFLRRQDSDGMSAVTTCYEPSEASIDWSVVTASATNFSVASDCEDRSVARKIPDPKAMITTTTTMAKTTTTKAEMFNGAARRRPATFLGCRNDKAVRVATNAHMVPEKALSDPPKRHLRGSDVGMPTARFHAESRVIDFESARASRTLYMH